MNSSAALAQLKALGNEKMRALNLKRGSGDNQFGVKHGDIRALAKKIKVDHELGVELWATGNLDARYLAVLLVKPALLSAKELDAMVRALDYSWLADWLDSYVIGRHPERESLRLKWLKDRNRWAARAGWSLTADRVREGADGLDIAGLLDRIETKMPKAFPEVQWTMNTCLAAIGIELAAFRKRAVAIGEALGLYRDYPVSKGCTSPFAPLWIAEMVRRKK